MLATAMENALRTVNQERKDYLFLSSDHYGVRRTVWSGHLNSIDAERYLRNVRSVIAIIQSFA
ncbi:hypothetical protein F370042G1_27460 [Escherichia coli]|nr:hypothetical protein TUM13735_14480 [Escherichia coli]